MSEGGTWEHGDDAARWGPPPHRAVIDWPWGGNWTDCTCPKDADHPKTYPIASIPEWA